MNHKVFTDQLDRSVHLPVFPPRRIVSLVPSQTELLYDLDLEERVVGVTKFCVHPKHWRKTKTIIGGTKQLHLDRIRDLQPDLIIANQEENDREQVLALAEEFPVWVSKVVDLQSALEMVASVGEITSRASTAQLLTQRIVTGFMNLPTIRPVSCAYLIWRKPYMVSGGDTFIQGMLEWAGFSNVFVNQNRYPTVTVEDLIEAQPSVLLLSSEPFPFKEKHIAELQEICPEAVIRLVDGEMFSWYGSRLLQAPAYFANLRKALL